MKNTNNDIKLEKEIKRKEFKLIRDSNSSYVHEKIKFNVKLALRILLRKYHAEGKYIGIYWPLEGEIDIRFVKDISNQKVVLPKSCKNKGLSYMHWSNNEMVLDSNRIPVPKGENTINPGDISILFTPALAIDKQGYRLGYGGGYFDRLRKDNLWFSIPSFVVISNNCISQKPLPIDSWDMPFDGWISEKGLHQIEPTK